MPSQARPAATIFTIQAPGRNPILFTLPSADERRLRRLSRNTAVPVQALLKQIVRDFIRSH